MTLHILSQPSSRSSSLKLVMSILGENDAVLLTCDAVYDLSKVINDQRVFVLQQDLMRRGLESMLETALEEATETDVAKPSVIDFDGFVALTEQHQTIQSWL